MLKKPILIETEDNGSFQVWSWKYFMSHFTRPLDLEKDTWDDWYWGSEN